MTRRYTKRRRAEQEANTRERIARAAMELHEELGPARTSISAIAERAGVQRLTVYRHFPEEEDLFLACSGIYGKLNPPPDPSVWLEIEDPHLRLRTALTAVYAYYQRTEPMQEKTLRDRPVKPEMEKAFASVNEYFSVVVNILTQPWNVDNNRFTLLHAAISHAISFPTWKSLVREQELPTEQAIQVMTGMVESVVRTVPDASDLSEQPG